LLLEAAATTRLTGWSPSFYGMTTSFNRVKTPHRPLVRLHAAEEGSTAFA